VKRGPVFAAVGDAFHDRYLEPVGRSLVGGNALNVAVQLARLGRQAAFFGAVGDDAAGRRVRAALAQNGVDATHLVTRPGCTARTGIGVDAAGERTFLHEDYGVVEGYRPGPDAVAALASCAVVHIGWLRGSADLARVLTAAPVTVSLDAGVNREGATVTIAFGSAGPSQDAADALLHRLLSRSRIAVVTRGARGAIASNGRERAEVGIRAVEVVDTTGAGDSFIAGFLAAHGDGADLAGALAAGRDAASFTCTHVGGFPQKFLPLQPP
jgi:fructoselysine 6-kinase